ncbi:DUF4838 domain-containing protein [bacterium]|nr:DUF4838 domain-containing protein [bacterium]
MTRIILRSIVLCLLAGFGLACGTHRPPAVEVAREGQPAMKIHVSPGGNAALQASAAELVSYLKQITGTEFEVVDVPFAGEGILLALAQTAESLDGADRQRLAVLGTESYRLQAGDQGVSIVGNSELAVQHGIFDLLERLGCRWLQPGERWTIVPHRPDLSLPALREFREPVFRDRRIWYAYGCGIDSSRDVLQRDYDRWHRASRLGGLARFQCGHSYPHTVGAHLEVFEQHPEYFAMDEDGKRLPVKTHQSLCYSNPDLARLFIEHRLASFRAARAENPYEFMISMDPNDGSQPCYCPACQALGNGSDQAIHLANQVAQALRQEFPDAAVGLYLYASHRLPPEKVRPEPNVYGQLAMGFNKTGFTFEELALGWRKAGLKELGIREYFGVMAWDWGLPGRGRGSSLDYMRTMIPRFVEWGATSFNAEINANWGTFGPAVYAAARLMWEPEADVEAIAADYFQHAFGSGARLMQDLHVMWGEDSRLTQSNLHRWLTQLERALTATAKDDAGVRQRMEDVVAYLHYVVLFRRWEEAASKGDREQAYAALKPLLTFTWRIRERQVMHAYALQRRLVNSGAAVLRPLKDGWRFNAPDAVWKDSTPVTTAELLQLFQQDLADHPVDERLVHFSQDLRPLDPDSRGSPPAGTLRGNSVWHVLVPAGVSRIDLTVEAGWLTALTVLDQKNQTIAERTWAREGDFEKDVGFPVPRPGRYTITLTGREYRPVFADGLAIVAEASEQHPFPAEYFGPCYFFVPAGVDTILAMPGMRLTIQAPSWEKRRDLIPQDKGARDCLEIPVGDDGGKVWRVDGQTRGAFYFYNIPPYVATDPSRLLVPVESLSARE